MKMNALKEKKNIFTKVPKRPQPHKHNESISEGSCNLRFSRPFLHVHHHLNKLILYYFHNLTNMTTPRYTKISDILNSGDNVVFYKDLLDFSIKYYHKVMFSWEYKISGNDMDPVLSLLFVSICFIFCFCGHNILLYHILRSSWNVKLWVSLRSAFHRELNWKSAISIGVSDRGHKKEIGEGSRLKTYKSSHKAIYDHQSRERKMDKLVYLGAKGWAWFKLTARETKRSDETIYE